MSCPCPFDAAHACKATCRATWTKDEVLLLQRGPATEPEIADPLGRIHGRSEVPGHVGLFVPTGVVPQRLQGELSIYHRYYVHVMSYRHDVNELWIYSNYSINYLLCYILHGMTSNSQRSILLTVWLHCTISHPKAWAQVPRPERQEE